MTNISTELYYLRENRQETSGVSATSEIKSLVVAFIRLSLNLSVAAERADCLKFLWLGWKPDFADTVSQERGFFLPLLITSQLLNLSVVETDCKAPGEDETKVTVFSFTNKQMKKKREAKDLQFLSEAKRWTTTQSLISLSVWVRPGKTECLQPPEYFSNSGSYPRWTLSRHFVHSLASLLMQ